MKYFNEVAGVRNAKKIFLLVGAFEFDKSFRRYDDPVMLEFKLERENAFHSRFF